MLSVSHGSLGNTQCSEQVVINVCPSRALTRPGPLPALLRCRRDGLVNRITGFLRA